MPTILITGANRGLGLALTRQYASDGWRVLATCRTPDKAEGLSGLAEASGGRITLHRLDVADFGQIDALAGVLASEAIDILLNNAGVLAARGDEWADSGFSEVDYGLWQEAFLVNTMAPMRMAEAFVEQVARSERKLMVFMSSQLGSITNTDGGLYQYRSSKAALNMVVKSLSVDLRPRGISTLAVHPGWVRTDMGGQSAPVGIEESIAGLCRVIGDFPRDQACGFLRYDGAKLPW